MNVWIVACIAFVLGAAPGIGLYVYGNRKQSSQGAKVAELTEENERLHGDNVAMLEDMKALEKQSHARVLEANAKVRAMQAHLMALEEQARAQIALEQERQTLKLRVELSEKEGEELRERLRMQEKMYRGTIGDLTEKVDRLEKRLQYRTSRKPIAQEGQISLDDLLTEEQ